MEDTCSEVPLLLIKPKLQLRRGVEDKSNIVFPISQVKHILWPLIRTVSWGIITCFIWKNKDFSPKLFLIPLLIWTTVKQIPDFVLLVKTRTTFIIKFLNIYHLMHWKPCWVLWTKYGALENFQKTGIKQSLFLFPNRERIRRKQRIIDR